MGRLAVSVVTGAALLFPFAAHAQGRPPGACNLTAPATLISLHTTSQVAAAISRPPASPSTTLWVAYDDVDPQHPNATGALATLRALSLLEIDHVDTARPEVHLHALGPGTVAGHALAVVGDHIVVAGLSATERVRVVAHPIDARGADATLEYPSPEAPETASVATDGTRTLLAWEDRLHVTHATWISADDQAPVRIRVWSGTRHPVASGAMAGVVFGVSSPPGRLEIAGAVGTTAPHPFGPVSGITALDASAAAWGVSLAYVAGGHARAAFVHDADGGGVHRSLGVARPERGFEVSTAVTGTSWGAIAVWTDRGAVMAAALGNDGAPAGSAMPLMDGLLPERARALAATGFDDDAVIVWSGANVRARDGSTGSAIRMVRVSCH